MERLTQEAQIGPFSSLRDKAEAKPRAFNDYDCFLAHARAVTALKAYEDICFDEDGKERITTEELSALVKAWDEGRVVVLPCDPCAAYYQWPKTEKYPSVSRFEGVYINECGEVIYHTQWQDFKVEDIGKTVFLSRAEAEAALGGGGDVR